MSIGKHPGGQIAVTAVADNRHDDGVAHRLTDLERRGDRAAGGYAAEDAFLRGQRQCGLLGVLLVDVELRSTRRASKMLGRYSCGQRRMPGIAAPSAGCTPTISMAGFSSFR